MSKIKNSLVKIQADIIGVDEAVCKRCNTTSEKTKGWYYISNMGYMFCPDCGEDLQGLLDEVRYSTIEKFVAK